MSSLPLPPLLVWSGVLLISLAVLLKASDWFTAAAERIGLLVLGVAAIIGGRLRIEYDLVKVDLPFLVGSAFFLALVLWSGAVSRSEGVLSLCGLGLYVCYALTGKAPVERELDGRESALAAEPRWLRSTLVLIGAAGLIYLGAYRPHRRGG